MVQVLTRQQGCRRRVGRRTGIETMRLETQYQNSNEQETGRGGWSNEVDVYIRPGHASDIAGYKDWESGCGGRGHTWNETCGDVRIVRS
jgi:hypothetical protein